MQFKTLYGPVQSGRLGLSLGVDLLGKRICSLDCLYCEVGPTRVHTLQRRPYMPARIILDELQAWKAQQLPRPEYITLGGLGEPCLNSDLQQIIAGSRTIFPDIPVAVLTNSTLLHDPDVRRELTGAQVILPSLDSLVQREFIRVNNPCKGVDLDRIRSGLLDFRSMYSGLIYLEILLIHGINDSEDNLNRLREFLPLLRPDRVDVVTMTRPGASPLAEAVDAQTLSTWRAVLQPAGATDFPAQSANGDQPRSRPRTEPSSGTADPKKIASPANDQALSDLILNSLRRRPQTLDQVCASLNLDCSRAEALFARLLEQDQIHQARELGTDFYQVGPGRHP